MFRLHRDNRSATFVVSVTVALFAAALFTRAQDPLPTQPEAPTIVCPDTVRAGESLYGSACDPNAPLVVTARSQSGHLGGSPDVTQDGDVNSFCFPTGALPPGSWIWLSALDGDGNLTIKFVKVTY